MNDDITPSITAPHYQGNLTERQFQRLVTDMADALGWSWHHETYSLGSAPGYPDLTLVHPRHGVVWLELKTPRGKISEAQRLWIARLREAGQHADIVYPSDLDRVESLLRGKTP